VSDDDVIPRRGERGRDKVRQPLVVLGHQSPAPGRAGTIVERPTGQRHLHSGYASDGWAD
jgi:hypothetical protein